MDSPRLTHVRVNVRDLDAAIRWYEWLLGVPATGHWPPDAPTYVHFDVGPSQFALGRYEESVSVCRSTIARHPKHAGAWRLLTVSLALLGKTEEAKAALTQTLTLQPDLSLAHVENNNIYAEPADRERFREGLLKAGLNR